MVEKSYNTYNILEEAKRVRQEVEQAREGTYGETEKRIFQPIFKVDYKNNSQEINEEENQMKFGEIEINDQDHEALNFYMQHLGEKDNDKGEYSEIANRHAVDQLEYTIGDSKFDIFNLVPEGYKILFCPKSETRDGAVSYEYKIIFIAGDITSLGSIATILHEIGHVVDNERLKKIDKTYLTEGGTSDEHAEAEKLRKEREASLFALRKMWREIRRDPQTKKDILLYLKNIAYYSYCDNSLSRVETSNSMMHFAKDLEYTKYEEMEQKRLDAWMRFRGSNQYTEWKQIEKFKTLNEFDEYGEWLEWIEETGKINDDDFYSRYFVNK